MRHQPNQKKTRPSMTINQTYRIKPTRFLDEHDQPIPTQVVLERVEWLCHLMKPIVDKTISEHHNSQDLESVLDKHNQQPQKGYVALSRLGWEQSVVETRQEQGTYVPERVLRMCREYSMRILRSSARRSVITQALLEHEQSNSAWEHLAQHYQIFLTKSELKNRYNSINNFEKQHGRKPTSLAEMEEPPTFKKVLLASSTDKQWQMLSYDPKTRLVTWQFKLPTTPNPQFRKQYESVSILYYHPQYVKEFTRINTPTMRIVKNKQGHRQLVLDVSYVRETPKQPSLAKRSRSASIGLDWGVKNLLSGVVAHKTKTGRVKLDSQGLFFKPEGIANKLQELKRENNLLHTKTRMLEKLVANNPNTRLRHSLETKLEKLCLYRDNVNQKRKQLNKQLAYAAARWVFHIVKQTGAKTIFLEDLRTLQVDKTNKWFAGVVSDTVRGQVFEFLEQLGLKNGVKVCLVNPQQTSKQCHKCGDSMRFYTHSDRKKSGYYWASCSGCGYVCDRDYNASVNIVSKGLLSLGKKRVVAKKVLSSPNRKHKIVRNPKQGPTPKQAKQPRSNSSKSFSTTRASWSYPTLRFGRLRRTHFRLSSQVGAVSFGFFPHVRLSLLSTIVYDSL